MGKELKGGTNKMTKRIIITIRVILIVGISIYFLDSFLEHKNKQQQPVQKKTKEIDYENMIKNPKKLCRSFN